MASRPAPKQRAQRKPRRASTPEGRESQLVGMAVNLAEQQIADGTASAQVISHFLQLGSSKGMLEREKLKSENELLRARVGTIESLKKQEELYGEALNAMRRYAGQDEEEPDYAED